MAIVSSGRQILLQDDFSSGQTNPGIWKINEWRPGDDNASFYNGTQIRQSLPVSKDGHLLLQLDTFHEGNLQYQPSFFGSEAISRQSFDLANGPLAFEATVRLSQDQSGLVVGFFTFMGPPATHDEIDFELMTKRFGEIQSNIYHNEPLAEGTWISHPLPAGGRLSEFHDYRIEWYENMVVWKVNDQILRTVTTPQLPGERNLVPDKPMPIHLNMWGAPSNWDVGDPSLAPTREPGQNRTFFAEVDGVLVERLARSTGAEANDLIVGTAGSEYLSGGAGHDLISGGAGNDVIDGGAGHDRVSYEGAAAQFAVSIDIGQRAIRIVDQSGAEGVDLVLGVEEVAFADGVFNLVDLTRSAFHDVQVFSAIIDLYTAYLDRAPDALGLHYWAQALSQGVGIDDLADFFFHEAADAIYGGLDDAGVVPRAYEEILGRKASAEEVSFWLGHAEATGLGIGQVPRAIVDAVRQAQSSDFDGVELKTALSAYYALEKGLGSGDAARALHDVADTDAGIALADLYAANAAGSNGALTVSVVGLDLSAFGLSL